MESDGAGTMRMHSENPVLGVIMRLRDFLVIVMGYFGIAVALVVLFWLLGGSLLVILHVIPIELHLNFFNELMCISVPVIVIIAYLVAILTAIKMLLEGHMDADSWLLVFIMLVILVSVLYLVISFLVTSPNPCNTSNELFPPWQRGNA